MVHKKKLAVFISHIYGDYQTDVIHGVIERAGEYGYRVDVYTTFDGEQLGRFLTGEITVLDIPSFDRYAGIICASGTYLSSAMRDRILEKLRTLTGIPVVEITDFDAGFPSVRMENNEMTGALTEHLIQKHGCKKLCYLGSSLSPRYSSLREKAFLSALLEAGLTPAENAVLSIDESRQSFMQALAYFTKDMTDVPDAVVCYNDLAAIRFWEAAENAGISIPEKMKIVGCDDLDEGKNLTPPLTTVTFPCHEVGRAAVDLLMSVRKSPEGASLPQTVVRAEPVIRGSCGCSCALPFHSLRYTRSLHRRTDDLEKAMLRSFHISSALSTARSLEEGLDILEGFVSEIEDCTGFFLCLNPDWNQLTGKLLELAGDPDASLIQADERLLKFAWQDGQRLPECSFIANDLLPEHIVIPPEEAHFISPMFFEDRIFGYMILAFRDIKKRYPFHIMLWVMDIAQFLENQRERRSRHVLTDHLEELYLKDSLTGLYNRSGFDHFLPMLLEKVPGNEKVSLLFLDVEGLKEINDTYGYSEGNFAISIAGAAVRTTGSEETVAARFDSGEFFMILRGDTSEADLALGRIMDYIDNYNALSSKPYKIKINAGTATCRKAVAQRQNGLETLFSAALQQLRENQHS